MLIVMFFLLLLFNIDKNIGDKEALQIAELLPTSPVTTLVLEGMSFH